MSHDFVRGQSVAENCFSHWGYCGLTGAFNPVSSELWCFKKLKYSKCSQLLPSSFTRQRGAHRRVASADSSHIAFALHCCSILLLPEASTLQLLSGRFSV